MEETTRSFALPIQKPISDSGYGSNKSNSNSQSQRSSGSSKSQHSSLSSEGQDQEYGNGAITKSQGKRNLGSSCTRKQGHSNEINSNLPSNEKQQQWTGVQSANNSSLFLKWTQYFDEQLKSGLKVEDCKETFKIVVALDYGIIVQMTENVKDVLGFARDIYIGKNLVDLLHPSDRLPLSIHLTHIGTNLSSPVNTEPYFCRLRHSGESGLVYLPFDLSMIVKEVSLEEKVWRNCEAQNLNSQNTDHTLNFITAAHLIITATRITSAFQYSDECPINPLKFTTRHSASCKFGHFETGGIRYLGHLPQDIIGTSILDYYHPDDMHLLKDIYEEVMLQGGRPFRSKPYRFRTFNGTFALMETDWSCFINPWSWKLEFVIGQHRVIKGPPNPDVFMLPREKVVLKISEQVLQNYKFVQNEILGILNETISRTMSESKRHGLKRRTSWGTHLELLLQSTSKAYGASAKSLSHRSSSFSLLEKDTVMLGEISPYHEHDDDQSGSNESSETPPSYGQLNYRENMERFFQSHPKTTHSNESAEKMDTNRSSSDDESKITRSRDYSSGSNNGNWSGSNGSGDCECLGESYLSEDLLSRHNDNMEKSMTQWHREHKNKIKHNQNTTSNPKPFRVRHPAKHGHKRTAYPVGLAADSGIQCKIPRLDAKSTGVANNLIMEPVSLHSAADTSTTAPFFTSESQMKSATTHPITGQDTDTLIPKTYSGIPLQLIPISEPHNKAQFFSFMPKSYLPRCYKSHGFLEKIASSFQSKDCVPGSAGKPVAAGRIPTTSHYNESHDLNQGSNSETSGELEESCSSSMYSLLKTDTTVTDSSSVNMSYEINQSDLRTKNTRSMYSFGLGECREFRGTGFESHGCIMNSDILLRFQLPAVQDTSDILAKDLNALGLLGEQSSSVNEQLSQLYRDLRNTNMQPHQLLEDEGTTSSGNESIVSESKLCLTKGAEMDEHSKCNYRKPRLVFVPNTSRSMLLPG